MSFIDITVGDGPPEDRRRKALRKAAQKGPKKPFLGVKFNCANGAYTRFYKKADGTAYSGRCPKCLKQVQIPIGTGGTASRFFDYDCGKES